MFHNHHMLVVCWLLIVYRKSRGFSCFSFLFKFFFHFQFFFFRWTHSDDDDDDDGGPLAYWWWWWWWTFVILTVAMLMMMDYLIYTSDSSCLVSVSLCSLIEWLDLYFGVFIHSSIFFYKQTKPDVHIDVVDDNDDGGQSSRIIIIIISNENSVLTKQKSYEYIIILLYV